LDAAEIYKIYRIYSVYGVDIPPRFRDTPKLYNSSSLPRPFLNGTVCPQHISTQRVATTMHKDKFKGNVNNVSLAVEKVPVTSTLPEQQRMVVVRRVAPYLLATMLIGLFC
jgi:hypothetical protein